MADYATENPPLGIGAILGETTSLLLSNFLAVCGIALIPIAVGMIASASLFGIDIVTGEGLDFDALDQSSYLAAALDMLVQIVAYSVATAMLVSFAYDVKVGRPIRLAVYLRAVIGNFLPLVVMSILSFILTMAGAFAFVIPGLWVYAVFSLIAPTIMVESAGFRAMTRSAELTQDYRWPIVGLLIVMFIITFIIGSIVGFVVGFVAAMTSSPILLFGLNIIANAIGFAFSCIMIAMLYARLREIKEGVSVDHLADVFR